MGPSLKITKLANTAALVHERQQWVELPQEKFVAKQGDTFSTISRRKRQKATSSPILLDCMKELLNKIGESLEATLRERDADLLKQFFPSRIASGREAWD